MFKEMRLFQKAATGVLVIFLGLMVLVGIAAYSRPTGSTRQDMSQAHLVRTAGIKESSRASIADDSLRN